MELSIPCATFGYMPVRSNKLNLELKFEELIDSFMENKVGVVEGFLGEELLKELRENLLWLAKEKEMHEAGIGSHAKLIHNKLIRSDMIYWLDRIQNNPHVNTFFDVMDNFVKYLNKTCYTGITGYEFHYALYEKGSFYKRHIDQFKDKKGRTFSMIMYLNENWKEGDGGELCVYQDSGSQLIAPTFGKCVFFKSTELEHEVLLSHRTRMSVTGWFKVG